MIPGSRDTDVTVCDVMKSLFFPCYPVFPFSRYFFRIFPVFSVFLPVFSRHRVRLSFHLLFHPSFSLFFFTLLFHPSFSSFFFTLLFHPSFSPFFSSFFFTLLFHPSFICRHFNMFLYGSGHKGNRRKVGCFRKERGVPGKIPETRIFLSALFITIIKSSLRSSESIQERV